MPVRAARAKMVPFFADFVTGFAPSKIPSVTRDMFEDFRKFWAL
jgi:hypothetical protein